MQLGGQIGAIEQPTVRLTVFANTLAGYQAATPIALQRHGLSERSSNGYTMHRLR